MRACPQCLAVYLTDPEHCAFDGSKLGDVNALKGQNLGGYVFDKLVGSGGTGCVYRGTTKAGAACAIKILFGEMVGDKSLAERFRREAAAVSQIDHPNVVSILDYGTAPNGSVYIVMEYLDGLPLKDILEQEAPLKPERAGRIAEHIAAGLSEAHRQGYVHRDLKPGNIIIVKKHNHEQAKILDFGIVASLREQESESRLTKTGYIVGTPTYMAPEQVDPSGVSTSVDVYALGVILYEMLCGQPPYRGTLEQILVAKMTEAPEPLPNAGELGRLALRFLERDPKLRPSSALQASAELSRLSLLSEDPATIRADLPDLPTYLEVGAAPATIRVIDGEGIDETIPGPPGSETVLPTAPMPKAVETGSSAEAWVASTRRVDFEVSNPGGQPLSGAPPIVAPNWSDPDTVMDSSPSFDDRPDTVIDARTIGPGPITVGSDSNKPTDASVTIEELPEAVEPELGPDDGPTRITMSPELSSDRLFVPSNEDNSDTEATVDEMPSPWLKAGIPKVSEGETFETTAPEFEALDIGLSDAETDVEMDLESIPLPSAKDLAEESKPTDPTKPAGTPRPVSAPRAPSPAAATEPPAIEISTKPPSKRGLFALIFVIALVIATLVTLYVFGGGEIVIIDTGRLIP